MSRCGDLHSIQRPTAFSPQDVITALLQTVCSFSFLVWLVPRHVLRLALAAGTPSPVLSSCVVEESQDYPLLSCSFFPPRAHKLHSGSTSSSLRVRAHHGFSGKKKRITCAKQVRASSSLTRDCSYVPTSHVTPHRGYTHICCASDIRYTPGSDGPPTVIDFHSLYYAKDGQLNSRDPKSGGRTREGWHRAERCCIPLGLARGLLKL